MRGEASRLADHESRDSLAPKLRAAGEDAWRIGNELFTITDTLDGSVRLERALTDPARPLSDKTNLLNQLIGSQADPITMEIMTDLVARRWSRASDIANAVEDFAVDAMMYTADTRGTTLEVSIELAQLQSALVDLPVMRSQLSDDSVPPEARVKLLHAVTDGSGLDPITLRLADHAAYNLRRRRYLATIAWLITKISHHMGESMVTVTTATPLTDAQIQSLIKIYSAKVGHPVHIHSVVDKSVLGGMRIQVGDEVTDNTVVAQLQNLRRKVGSRSKG